MTAGQSYSISRSTAIALAAAGSCALAAFVWRSRRRPSLQPSQSFQDQGWAPLERRSAEAGPLASLPLQPVQEPATSSLDGHKSEREAPQSCLSSRGRLLSSGCETGSDALGPLPPEVPETLPPARGLMAGREITPLSLAAETVETVEVTGSSPAPSEVSIEGLTTCKSEWQRTGSFPPTPQLTGRSDASWMRVPLIRRALSGSWWRVPTPELPAETPSSSAS
eukprot:TRINITY_DN4345_c0_g1_i1.p2 TRINITY_DN4345_c0_g1~~TRINITY_DN4345_c0_g1_i1.p2  ORF type:complete len:223 (-),score=26.63 TRINITY_DN4345_c0_g1_i1:176-844(-)